MTVVLIFGVSIIACSYIEVANSSAQTQTNIAGDDWPMIRHDAAHTGLSRTSLASNLTLLWSFNPNASQGFLGRVPAIVNEGLYITDRNSLYCVNALTGNLLWRQNLTMQKPLGYDEFSVAVFNGYVYSDAAAYNALTGDVLFNYPVQGSTSPTVADGIIYLGSNDGGVTALNASTGVIVWNKPGRQIHFSPAVSNGVVYYSEGDILHQQPDSCYALNATTGELLWNRLNVGGLYAHIAIADDFAFVGGTKAIFGV